MNYDLIILCVAFSLFGIELFVLKLKKRKITLEQTVLNLGLGMIERLIGILTINFGLYFFTFLIPWRFIDPFGPPWLAFAVAFIAVDLMWYVYHRLSHRVSMIWAAHMIHHQSKEYNFSVNFAISPLGFITRIFVYGTLIFFGITPENIIIANAVNAFYQYLLHSELWPEFKGWERIFVTPKFHQLHHSSVHEHLDVNYGGVFTIWDRIFRSYKIDDIPVVYGLTKEIEQQDPFHTQALFFLKLIHNFRKLPFRKAVALLFLGPEAQSSEMPRVYKAPIKHNFSRIIFGILLFVVGYVFLCQENFPNWVAFSIGFTGIFIMSGLVIGYRYNYKEEK